MASLLYHWISEIDMPSSISGLEGNSSQPPSRGPLSGIKVVEFAGLAPGPFAGLVLADFGASVVRIDRADVQFSPDVLARGKRSLAVDLKVPAGREVVRRLITQADVVIDPFRPQVLEKLGLGPDTFLGEDGLNKSLVFARLAGFPRTGPYKDMAGHDINYLALSGILSMFPGNNAPAPPLNLMADFGGGGFTCAIGILIALFSRSLSKDKKGQVVDIDMVSGTRYLSSFPLLITYLFPHQSTFRDGNNPKDRGTGILAGGAPHYNVYACKDGKWMSVGCLEPQFYKLFIEIFTRSLSEDFLIGGWKVWRPTEDMRVDESQWPKLREFLEQGFRTKTRDEWAKIFFETDACCVPILFPEEAAKLSRSGSIIPGPAPNLAETPARIPRISASSSSPDFSAVLLKPGQHSEEILRELGLSPEEMGGLARSGALGPVRSKL